MKGRTLLKQYLKERGLRSADLVREGFDSGLVSRWLSGQRRPGLDLATRLERVTGGKVPAEAWVE